MDFRELGLHAGSVYPTQDTSSKKTVREKQEEDLDIRIIYIYMYSYERTIYNSAFMG